MGDHRDSYETRLDELINSIDYNASSVDKLVEEQRKTNTLLEELLRRTFNPTITVKPSIPFDTLADAIIDELDKISQDYPTNRNITR